MSDEVKKSQMFIFSEKRAENLIYESLLNEKLSSFLMKRYEFFMCSRAIYETITTIELEREKRYNDKEGSFGYIIDQVEAKALQMVVSASDAVKLELAHYNINFTVH